MTDAAGAPQHAGVVADNAYDNEYSRVKAGPDGGSIWQERASLPSETTPAATATDPTKPGDTAAKPPALVPDQEYQFGDLKLSGQLRSEKAAPFLNKGGVPSSPQSTDQHPPAFSFEKMQNGSGCSFNCCEDQDRLSLARVFRRIDRQRGAMVIWLIIV